jgi:uncharacterized membrane protein
MLKSIVFPLVLAVISAGVLIGYRPASAATAYSVSQVNSLSLAGIPYGSSADRSKIAGRAAVAGSQRAHLYADGAWTNLGVLPGFVISQANDANDAGQTVGWVGMNVFGTNADNRGFVYTGGVMTQLPAFAGTGLTHPLGINNAGTIVGASVNKPFRMNIGDTSLTQLATPAAGGNGFGKAHAINNAGDVVGWAGVGVVGVNDQRVPAIWDGGVTVSLLAVPSGALNAEATLITEGGVIAGAAAYATTTRGFVYDDAGLPIDIGTLAANHSYSEIIDVNDARDVVGLSRLNTVPFTSTPILWRDGTMVDLNALLPPSSGWVITRPISINDAGEILGLGTFNGSASAFKLTPIPEPAAVAWLATMTVAAALRRRRPGARVAA